MYTAGKKFDIDDNNIIPVNASTAHPSAILSLINS